MISSQDEDRAWRAYALKQEKNRGLTMMLRHDVKSHLKSAIYCLEGIIETLEERGGDSSIHEANMKQT